MFRVACRSLFVCLFLIGLSACWKSDSGPVFSKAAVVRLERLAVSKPPAVAQVQPYDEGLVFHSYAVKEVVHGELPAARVQLGHWAVVDGVAQEVDMELGKVIEVEVLPLEKVPGARDLYQANELDDYDSPLYVEVPPASRPVATGFRNHYGGAFSKQMTLYWPLREQLRLVVLGNSRAGVGVLTGRFFPEINAQTPVALNLSPPGSNIELQSLLVKDYVLPLPNLEWVVWGVCPRYFNQDRRESDRMDLFTESHGRRFDLENHDELWPIRTRNAPLTVAEVEKFCPGGTDIYGATPREDGHSPQLADPAARRKFLDFFSIVRFDWDQAQWDLFQQSVEALDRKGVRVLLFTLPTHPLAREGRACDPDGSGREHEAMVMEKLQALDRRLPNLWFEDIHRAGHHDFSEEDFSDAGHLDRSGAERLTGKLVSLVDAIRDRQP